jgi:hypothetical protein
MGERELNPYVGPRPFERDDRAYFFGRSRQVRDVVSLVIAQPVLLLYAASGAGKSSLLNAGVVPTLKERGAEVLPVGRVLAGRSPPEDVRNAYAWGLLTYLAGADDGVESSVADFLAGVPRDGDGRLRILVIDQFEELFTAYPGRWRDRAGFLDGLREAIDADPLLRVVLAIREDHLAQLDPLATRLPLALRTRFRLERLDPEGALDAVRKPLAVTARRFAAGVAEALVEELLTFRVDLGRGKSVPVAGEFVEPVQLQVVCRSLFEELPREVEEISAEHVREFADVDEVLARFYEDAIRAATATGKVRERRLRRWIEDQLITPGGTRGSVYGTATTVGEMPRRVVDVLADKRLVRAEPRAGALWYELTHDRLIEPIQRSNAKYDAPRRYRTIAAVTLALAIAGGVAVVALVATILRQDEAARKELSVLPVRVTARPHGVDVSVSLQGANLGGRRGTVRALAFDAQTRAQVATAAALVVFRGAADTQEVTIPVRLPETAQIVRVRVSALSGATRSVARTSGPVNRLPDLAPKVVTARFTRRVIHLLLVIENNGALTAPSTKVAVSAVFAEDVIERLATLRPLAQGREAGVNFEVPRRSPELVVRVTVDAGGRVTERNEINNSALVRCLAAAPCSPL